MSFLFIHGMNESPTLAGLHLALITIVLGLVARQALEASTPGWARTMTTSAMLLCICALGVLSRSLAGFTV